MNSALFLLYTCRKHLKKTRACLETWGQACDHLLVITDEHLPIARPQEVIASFGYEKLCEKTLLMWNLIYKKYGHQYAYFVKVDDDTFVDPKKISCFLKKQPEGADYLGNTSYWSQIHGKEVTWAAGSMYIISQRALRHIANLFPHLAEFSAKYGSAEDVAVAHLLGEQNIHCQNIHQHLLNVSFKQLSKINDHTFSVSALTPARMVLLYFVWKISKGFKSKAILERLSDVFVFLKILKLS
ncbi:hypothetical protein EBZ39_07745 [bacterium]|nr:hypothetical protein [bacterium]